MKNWNPPKHGGFPRKYHYKEGVLERRLAAVDFRLQGKTFKEIGALLGGVTDNRGRHLVFQGLHCLRDLEEAPTSLRQRAVEAGMIDDAGALRPTVT